MKRSQIALEFTTMIGVGMVVVITLLAVVYYMFTEHAEKKNYASLQDLGFSLQNELILAAQVEKGYERKIFIPQRLEGIEYNLTNSESEIVITYKGADLVFATPKTTGTLVFGENTIRNTGQEKLRIN